MLQKYHMRLQNLHETPIGGWFIDPSIPKALKASDAERQARISQGLPPEHEERDFADLTRPDERRSPPAQAYLRGLDDYGRAPWRLNDLRAITIPITRHKLSDKLSKSSIYFNVFFLDKMFWDEYLHALDTDKKSPDFPSFMNHMIETRIKKSLHKVNEEQGGSPLTSSVNLVLTATTGDPYSPWMILHALGEAVDITERINYAIADEVQMIIQEGHEVPAELGSGKAFVDFKLIDTYKFLVKNMLICKSFLNPDTVRDEAEYIAEYLWGGHHIRRNPMLFDKIAPKFGPEGKALIERIYKRAEQTCEEVLQSYVGKILVRTGDVATAYIVSA